ncbi:methyltransferase domain-containing protein [Prevotella sp.]|uniref:class I SAM-dependent methyltransferase n=1 Tax=uncultured Prevotella sp. TaxID=159272 RepID=UPI0025EDDF53|nr:methyltransferase domain-containing protein [Prevotella sp.]MCI7119369.1 methyltransferase domain-containing protein [Prevotella sp.]
MKYTTIDSIHDPMGAAIRDYHLRGKAARLRVMSSMFDEDEMPVDHLFRTFDDMPHLEQKALNMAYGKVLDIGAGAGCHALALQERGMDVKAIDISPLSCEVMKERGIKDVECVNLFCKQLQGKYDTLLLLMNGTGIAGKLSQLPALLNRLKELLSEEGQILIDSSDLKYIYENEDGSMDIDLNAPYYGEVDYQMQYRDIKGEPFDWLYTDPMLLASVSKQCGLQCQIMEQGEHYDYLAKLTL